jgi:hypothetical protein
MEMFLVLVVVAMIIHAIITSLSLRQERKEWIYGIDYDNTGNEDRWITAKLSSDPDNIEFDVMYKEEGNYFVDRDYFSYLPVEIKIKRDDNECD